MATSVSSLPAASLHASRAALDAALAENKANNGTSKSSSPLAEKPLSGDPDLEDGEIQEIDMESQAEGIRTVFSNPKDFNVKVCPVSHLSPHLCSSRVFVAVVGFLRVTYLLSGIRFSTPSIRRGRYGSIRRLPRAEIFRKHP